MSTLGKVEVYDCGKGIYEHDRTRALAWLLVNLVEKATGTAHLSFAAALALVANRAEVEAVLRQIDQEAA